MKSYLCAIIDDYSRYIVSAQFFETESNYALEITLKDAISIFGIPNRLYSDYPEELEMPKFLEKPHVELQFHGFSKKTSA